MAKWEGRVQFNAEVDETNVATDSRCHADALFLDQMERGALLHLQQPFHLLLRGERSDEKMDLVVLGVLSRSELLGWR